MLALNSYFNMNVDLVPPPRYLNCHSVKHRKFTFGGQVMLFAKLSQCGICISSFPFALASLALSDALAGLGTFISL